MSPRCQEHEESAQPVHRRRTFLAGAAAAAASWTIVRPSAARGSAANSKVELGLVGCGKRGSWIAGLCAKHGGYHVAALADYFPEVTEAAGERLGVPKERCFSGLLGYQRLLDSRVDAVALETPPWFFPEHARAAVEAGAHVYMAKPVAVDAPGCQTIAALGRKATTSKRCFLVDFQTRTEPWFQQAVQAAHEGALGKIALLSSIYCDECFLDPPKTDSVASRFQHLIWVNDVDLGGSYLVNAGIHAIDVALWLADETPLVAQGSSRLGRPDAHGDSHDVYSITYEFPSGLILNHRGEHIRNQHPFTCGCAAYGQGAYLEGFYEGRGQISGGPKDKFTAEFPGLYAQGAMRNIATFHKNITEGLFDNPTVEPSVNSTLATILGREAAASRSKLTWQGMLKANKRIELDLTGLVE